MVILVLIFWRISILFFSVATAALIVQKSPTFLHILTLIILFFLIVAILVNIDDFISGFDLPFPVISDMFSYASWPAMSSIKKVYSRSLSIFNWVIWFCFIEFWFYILKISNFNIHDLQIFPHILYVTFSCTIWLCHSRNVLWSNSRKSSSWDVHG